MIRTAIRLISISSLALLCLNGCVKADSDNTKLLNFNSDIPMAQEQDSKFGLIFDVVAFPSMESIESKGLETTYAANNGYDTAGQIKIESVSIVHNDGTVLAIAPIGITVQVSSKDVVSDSLILPVNVLDQQKLRLTLETYNKAVSNLSNQAPTDDKTVNSGVSVIVKREYYYELGFVMNHPERGPLKRVQKF